MMKKYFVLLSLIFAMGVGVKGQTIRRVIPGADITAVAGTNWTTDAYGGTAGLKAAIAASVANDEVWVMAGTYKTGTARDQWFSFVSGVKIYGGFGSTLDDELTDRNWATNVTILSGDINGDDSGGIPGTDNSYHVIYNASPLAVAPVLDGFTVSGGYANNGTGNDTKGGGIFLNNLANGATIQNCTITGNFAVNSGAQGGGLFINTCSSIAVTNCLITNNVSTGGTGANGGGVWLLNVAGTFTNLKVQNNYSCLDYFASPKTYSTASGGFGGGLYVSITAAGGGRNSTFNNCLVSNNFGARGGGVYLTLSSPTDPGTANVTFNNFTVAGNWAKVNCGGLLTTTVQTRTTFVVNNSIFYGNNADAGNIDGQAASNTITLRNSVIPSTFGSNGSTKVDCITSDPQYADAASKDFRIKGSSPCADTGNNDYGEGPTDIRGAGFARFLNKTTGAAGTVDMGCYEYLVGTDPSGVAPLTWTGATSSDWTDGTNWSSGTAPISTSTVIIPDAGTTTNDPVVATTVSVTNLTIQASGVLTIAPAGALTVSATVTGTALAYDQLIIQSSATQSGSLIHTTGSIAGRIYRYYTGGVWHQVGLPVATTIGAAFLSTNSGISTNGSDRAFTTFNTASKEWDAYFTNLNATSTTNSKGYILRLDADGTVNYSGNILVNTKDIPLNNAVEGERWNLIGNPFASAIKINSVAGGNSFLAQNGTTILDDGSYYGVYFWNSATSSYELVNSSITDAVYAQSGQGFFVKANASGTPSALFRNNMQAHQTGILLKSASSTPEIILAAKFGNENANARVKFMEGASKGLDVGYDGGAIKMGAISLSTRLVEDNGVDFMIQCLPQNAYSNLVLPVGVDCKAGGELVLSAQTINLPAGCKVILEDKVARTFTDLKTGNYTVTLPANTSGSDRFVLHTSSLTTKANVNPMDNLSAYVFNSEIKVKGTLSSKASASLYDLQGRLLLNRNLDEGSINSIQLPSGINGIYMLMVKDNGQVKSFKLAIAE